MRRRIYSELPGMQPADLMESEPAPAPLTGGIDREKAEWYRAEIHKLFAIVQQHRLLSGADGQAKCLYADEKLGEASAALDRGDGENSWLHLYGAATFCKTFEIAPEKAERTLNRLNSPVQR